MPVRGSFPTKAPGGAVRMSAWLVRFVVAVTLLALTSCSPGSGQVRPKVPVTEYECTTDHDCAQSRHCSSGECVMGSGTNSIGGGGYCPPSERTFGDRCR